MMRLNPPFPIILLLAADAEQISSVASKYTSVYAAVGRGVARRAKSTKPIANSRYAHMAMRD